MTLTGSIDFGEPFLSRKECREIFPQFDQLAKNVEKNSKVPCKEVFELLLWSMALTFYQKGFSEGTASGDKSG